MKRLCYYLSIILVLIAVITLAACNIIISPTTEELTQQPIPTITTQNTSLTSSSTTNQKGALPDGLNTSVLISPKNIIGSMAMISGGVYAYPYNDDIVICIQSDVQNKSGLHLVDQNGTWIRDLNTSASYINLIVVDNFLFALDYLDNNRLLIVDLLNPGVEYPLDIHTLFYGIANGYIYYLNPDKGNQLYRCLPDGSEVEKLTEQEVLYFYLLSDRIIYIENTPESNRSIHRMSLDGEPQSSEENRSDYSFVIANGTLFSAVNSGPQSYIYSFNLDVELNRYVDIKSPMSIESPVHIISINGSDQFLFIEGMKDGSDVVTLWRMNYLGADILQLSDAEGVNGVQVIGDYVYFRANSYRSQHCVIKNDGTEFRVLFGD